MRKFFYILMSISLIFLTGCESSSSTTVASSVAKLSGFSFANNDSMPGLSKAVFTIEERLDTGMVWNKDSMLFGTRLDTVVPRFVFAATPGAAWLTFPDTLVRLTGYDTLDFTKRPIYLTIRSQDNSTTKTYEIRPTVHAVDPDLYQWEQINSGIYPPDESEQRVVELGDDFMMLVSNGFAMTAYRSADGEIWDNEGRMSGLPAGANVRRMISDGRTLYYAQDHAVYTSTDAIHWTEHAVAPEVITMVMYWNEGVWVLTQDDKGYELAIYEDEEVVLVGLRPDGDFPISDFSTVTFESASERDRAMIIGGFSENGRSLNTRWNLEYSPHMMENNGYRMEEFSIDRPEFTSLTGISVIWYNDELQMYGGVDANMQYFGRDILISEDEGLNWTAADTAKNQLPAVYQARQKQSVIVRDNDIYVFGGQDQHTTYSDVYRGRLNSIEW